MSRSVSDVVARMSQIGSCSGKFLTALQSRRCSEGFTMAGESEAFAKSELAVVLCLDKDFSPDEGFSPRRLSWFHLEASLNVNLKRG
ncbi:hypothetical protein L195_g010329 [Trifolium pratense]|uniref:Uncharacterized protein n=1 Tax=Trifolium pratense TaxID=57577 RepID=A0A2K3PEE2_TRIPR|nr:hypothetical protein L195_g010329 [Trifolium pratense]